MNDRTHFAHARHLRDGGQRRCVHCDRQCVVRHVHTPELARAETLQRVHHFTLFVEQRCTMRAQFALQGLFCGERRRRGRALRRSRARRVCISAPSCSSRALLYAASAGSDNDTHTSTGPRRRDKRGSIFVCGVPPLMANRCASKPAAPARAVADAAMKGLRCRRAPTTSPAVSRTLANREHLMTALPDLLIAC